MLEIIQIDIMSETKDKLDNPDSTTQINQLIDSIVRDFETLTHIAISVPMNTNAEAFAARGSNFSIEPAVYAKKFADRIHFHNIGVTWRMTDCTFESGGLYGFDYDNSSNNSYWLTRATSYVSTNSAMFADGDIIAPYPEADAHQQLERGGHYNDFFVQLKAALDTTCAGLGLTCQNGLSSQNFTGVIQGGRQGQMFSIPNRVSIDHYGASLGLGKRLWNSWYLLDGNFASQASISGTDTFTVPLSITESSSTRCDFVPEKIAYNNEIDVYIVNKGTGAWTMTIHNENNQPVQLPDHTNYNVKNNSYQVTISNASLLNNAWNTFAIPWDNPDTDHTYHFHLTSTVANGTAHVLTGHSGNENYLNFKQYKTNATAEALELDIRKLYNKYGIPINWEELGDYWSLDASRSSPVRNQAQHTTYLQSITTMLQRLVDDGILRGFGYWRYLGGTESIGTDADSGSGFDYQLNYPGLVWKAFFDANGIPPDDDEPPPTEPVLGRINKLQRKKLMLLI